VRVDVRFGSKADMCSALGDVCFVPIADIASLFDPSIRAISNWRCSEADSLALGD
jgi:hypothetical protein